MKAPSVRTVVRYLAGWSTMICFVVLLTLIFSFLGTIICAVLAGMMLGPAKPGRGHTVAVSLIFPGVISVLLRSSRAELAGRQILLLSLLCFGAFWLTYIVASAVLFYEHSNQSGVAAQPREQPLTTVKREPSRVGPPRVETSSPFWEGDTKQSLTLDALQGKWCCETCVPSRPGPKKVMEIREEELVLSILDDQGSLRQFAKGHVRVWNSAALVELASSVYENGSAGDAAVSI